MTSLSCIPDLLNWKIDLGLDTFVETGCFKGDGIQSAIDFGFKRIFSCDINTQWFDVCGIRFSDHKNVHLVNGSSIEFLHWLFTDQMVNSGCLFWFDAHFKQFCAGVEHDNPDKLDDSDTFPLFNELQMMKEYTEGCVAFCDDMRVMKDSGRWNEVLNHMKIDRTIQELINVVECDKYQAQYIDSGEGILRVTPCVNG